MVRLWRSLSIALILLLCAINSVALAQTADQRANPRTKRVLEYLRQLPDQPAQRIISGQYIGSAACCSIAENPDLGAEKYIEDLSKATGHVVGMVGADYNDFNNAFGEKEAPSYGKPVSYQRINAILKRYSRAGSLITVGWHVRNPWTGGPWKDLNNLGPLTDLIDPQKRVSAAWLRELDLAAEGLQDLQSAGVVVLWRPLLEMNGRWFWWGATQPTLEQFRAVWAHMFHYFCDIKGLHNLLWVYAPGNSSPAMPDQKPADFYYPGPDLVDIIGLDDYHDTMVIHRYRELSLLGKPLGLTEKGPSLATAGKTSNAFETLAPELRTKYPLITFFQAWSGPLALVNNAGHAQLINDPLIANQSAVARALEHAN